MQCSVCRLVDVHSAGGRITGGNVSQAVLRYEVSESTGPPATWEDVVG